MSAQDNDRGENKKVIYKIFINPNKQPLQINPDTGLITVLNPSDIVRRRGEDPYIQVRYYLIT